MEELYIQEVKLIAALVETLMVSAVRLRSNKSQLEKGQYKSNVSIMMQYSGCWECHMVASGIQRFLVSVLEETTLPSTRVCVTVITLVFTVFWSSRASWSLNGKIKKNIKWQVISAK